MQENPQVQEIRQRITNVVPQLAERGSYARALPEMLDLHFPRNPYPSDLLTVAGTHRYLGRTDLRLYEKVNSQGLGLRLKVNPVALNHGLFFAWEGGALNSDAPELYGHLLDQVDFCFDLAAGQFRIRSISGGQYEQSYPFNNDSRVIYRPNLPKRYPVEFYGFSVGNDMASLSIGWADGPMEVIVLPAVINKIDLKSL